VPKIVDEEAQRGRIRAAARSVFARSGLTTTGLTHVARAAGMQRSSLYHYYADKAALVRDLADEVLAEEEAAFRAALEGEGSALERIERLAEAVVRVFGTRAALGRVLLELWASEPARVRPALRRVRATLAELIRVGQERGEIAGDLDPDAAALLLVALLDGLLVQVFLDPRGVRADAPLLGAVVRAVRRILAT
jgi:AcrR family transcriptional regulator